MLWHPQGNDDSRTLALLVLVSVPADLKGEFPFKGCRPCAQRPRELLRHPCPYAIGPLGHPPGSGKRPLDRLEQHPRTAGPGLRLGSAVFARPDMPTGTPGTIASCQLAPLGHISRTAPERAPATRPSLLEILTRFHGDDDDLGLRTVLVRQGHAAPFAVGDPPDRVDLVPVLRPPASPAPCVLARFTTRDPRG